MTPTLALVAVGWCLAASAVAVVIGRTIATADHSELSTATPARLAPPRGVALKRAGSTARPETNHGEVASPGTSSQRVLRDARTARLTP